MAPSSSSSAAAAAAATAGDQQLASQGGDTGRAALKDWKKLIDNGLASGDVGSGQQALAGHNQTAAAPEDAFAPRVHSGGSNLIPLYCGLLGALICGLIIWIVLKHARARGRDSKLQPPGATGDAAASVPLAKMDATAAHADDDAEGGSDSMGRRRLADLSESRMRRLEQILDVKSSWKMLADELGYEPEAVAKFESCALLETSSPSGLLLRHWASAAVDPAAATMTDLRRHLLAAGLVDAQLCLASPRGDSTTAAAAAERKRRHRPQQHASAVVGGAADSRQWQQELTAV